MKNSKIQTTRQIRQALTHNENQVFWMSQQDFEGFESPWEACMDNEENQRMDNAHARRFFYDQVNQDETWGVIEGAKNTIIFFL